MMASKYRPIEDIPLPGDELPSRHAMHKAGEPSVCPWHRGRCAYTGDETDRCPVCHALWLSYDDEYDEHARHIAARLLEELSPEDRARLRNASERQQWSQR
jgi:hypothetical protein